jgi:hypothetical protein
MAIGKSYKRLYCQVDSSELDRIQETLFKLRSKDRVCACHEQSTHFRCETCSSVLNRNTFENHIKCNPNHIPETCTTPTNPLKRTREPESPATPPKKRARFHIEEIIDEPVLFIPLDHIEKEDEEIVSILSEYENPEYWQPERVGEWLVKHLGIKWEVKAKIHDVIVEEGIDAEELIDMKVEDYEVIFDLDSERDVNELYFAIQKLKCTVDAQISKN